MKGTRTAWRFSATAACWVCLAGAVGAWADPRVDELIRRLGDPDSSVRAEAACALGSRSGSARHSVPALVRLLREGVRAGVMRERPVAELWPPPRDRPLTACEAVAQGLGSRLYVPSQESDAAWAEWERYKVQGPVVWALVALEGGEQAARAVIDLFRQEPELRCDYRFVSGLLSSLGDGALPAFEGALQDETTLVRYFAVRALPALRPLPAGAEALIQHAIEWDTGDVRSAAVVAAEQVRASCQRRLEAAAWRARAWLGAFSPYPGARRVCARADWTLYAARAERDRVLAFYGLSARETAAGAMLSHGANHLFIEPASRRAFPECDTRLREGEVALWTYRGNGRPSAASRIR